MKFVSPAGNAIRILTVDDHPILREGVAAVLATPQCDCADRAKAEIGSLIQAQAVARGDRNPGRA